MPHLPFHSFLTSSDFFCSQATVSNASTSVLCSLESASIIHGAPELGTGPPWQGAGYGPTAAARPALPAAPQPSSHPARVSRNINPKKDFPKPCIGIDMLRMRHQEEEGKLALTPHASSPGREARSPWEPVSAVQLSKIRYLIFTASSLRTTFMLRATYNIFKQNKWDNCKTTFRWLMNKDPKNLT